MIEKVSVPVSVTLYFDHRIRRVIPQTVTWEGQTYQIVKIGLHHTYRQGRTLFHVFSVAARELFFRIVLNTDTLHWQLEEIADGNAN